MKKTTLLSLALFASLHMAAAQTLEKMTWFNEPEQWEISGNTLSLFVTPQSDYWRISHYGFTVDDAPFYYATYGGEFEAKIRISGEYRERFDQAGLMLRIDHENYIKAGIEFVDEKFEFFIILIIKAATYFSRLTLVVRPVISVRSQIRRLNSADVDCKHRH